MTNEQITRAWAKGTQKRIGKLGDGLNCDGATLYSYRTPIAIIRRGHGAAWVLDRKHSPSKATSGHLALALRALAENTSFKAVPADKITPETGTWASNGNP